MSFFDGAKICVIECTSFMLSLIALLGGGHGIFMTKPRILHLISPARLDKLNEHIGQYNNNLVETAHAIDIPWHAYLGTNAVTHGLGAKEIMPSLNKQLRNLQQQRSEIAGNIAALFQ